MIQGSDRLKIRRIPIERFLGIKNLDVVVDDRLQLIAGPNNSCKSSFLKAMDLFFSGNEDISMSQYVPQNLQEDLPWLGNFGNQTLPGK